jgi:hypothetical protein
MIIKLIEIVHKGEVQLYDIYINDEWCGSRRTLKQCIIFIEQGKRQ